MGPSFLTQHAEVGARRGRPPALGRVGDTRSQGVLCRPCSSRATHPLVSLCGGWAALEPRGLFKEEGPGAGHAESSLGSHLPATGTHQLPTPASVSAQRPGRCGQCARPWRPPGPPAPQQLRSCPWFLCQGSRVPVRADAGAGRGQLPPVRGSRGPLALPVGGLCPAGLPSLWGAGAGGAELAGGLSEQR